MNVYQGSVINLKLQGGLERDEDAMSKCVQCHKWPELARFISLTYFSFHHMTRAWHSFVLLSSHLHFNSCAFTQNIKFCHFKLIPFSGIMVLNFRSSDT